MEFNTLEKQEIVNEWRTVEVDETVVGFRPVQIRSDGGVERFRFRRFAAECAKVHRRAPCGLSTDQRNRRTQGSIGAIAAKGSGRRNCTATGMAGLR
jgi:hypothetical protein